MREGLYCFWHDPDSEEEVSEARRVLEVATIDALGLDNSIARSRVLISAALAAIRLLETDDFEARLVALETAAGVTQERPAPAQRVAGFLYAEGLS